MGSAMIACAGCSSDSTTAGADGGHPPSDADAASPIVHADASPPRADAEADATKPLDPFTGDCTTARWGPATPECWSCLCNTCADSLNKCGPDCGKAVQCAAEKHALVGVSADLSCELRAFSALCLQDPAAQAATTQLLAFDTCLINSHKPPEHLRACEKECNTVYTGDVCQRFPAPPDGG